DGMEGEDPNDFWDINGNGKRDFGEPVSNDDWAYSQSYYQQSNGTEGNENNVNGRIPDTEDINGNGSLDQINNYFQYSFSLDKSHPDSTKYVKGANDENRWYLYRLPLAEPDTVVGAPDMTRLEFARIWIDEVPAQTQISIAEINLVGNDWKEKGTASVRDSIIVSYDETDDKTVIATIINTHDNAEEYDPPPGVSGVRDRITRVEAKEQSLVIRVNGLESQEQGILQKTFYQAEDYIRYRKMKMFIHGGNELGTQFPELGGEPSVILFLRLGANEQNYYEIRQPVYQGWEGNNMEVDLAELTNLKLNPDTTYFVNNQEVREREFDQYRMWRIVGDPSLTNVKQLVLGVENISENDFSGELWVNELRLSEVFKDKGIAMRARVDLKVADLFNVNAEIDRQDADFHNINNRFGSGDNRVSYNINSGFQLHKFFPRSWGLSLPISFNYKTSRSTPKYVSGSDILVTDSTPDTTLEKIRRQSESYGYGVSFRKTTKSNNFFIKHTLDNFSVSFNGAQSSSSDSRTEKQTRETYSGSVSYNLNFDTKAYFRPFFWLDQIPVAKKLGELKYYYWPTGLDLKASGTQTKSYSLTRTGLENSSRPFTISRSAQTGYRPLKDLSFDFSRSHKSDMTQIASPKEELLKGKFGELTSMDQNASAKFNPKIFSWLTTNFSYSSNFQWSNNLQLKSTGTGRSASNSGNISGNFTFDPDKLIKSIIGSDKKSSSRRQPGDEDEQEEKKKKINLLYPFKLLFSGVDFITRNIQPISINYSQRDNKSYSALEEGMPSWDFMLGFDDSTGVGLVQDVGTNRNSFRNSQTLSLQSGFKISRNIDVTLRFSSDNSRNQTTQITGDQSFSAYKLSEDQEPIPFPEWSVRWTGVEKLPFLKDLMKRVSFDHSFTGKSTEAWQNAESNITRKSYNASFRPLLGMNITFQNDISATVRYNLSNSFDENVRGGSGGTRSTNSDFSIQAKYAKSGGFRIPIPVWPFKNKEIKNDMDFSFSFNMSSNVDEQNVQGGKWEEMNKTAKWSLKPQLTYRFSTNVSGGIHFEYGKNESKRMGKTSYQDFGLNVRIDIRGR
ncbi:cell surface protein SprA, partial [candidate division KSB1 bacterium]|nr:cell surface protein SprA [candidate division KSB1 bacterium]